MVQDSESRKLDQYKIRFSADLHERIRGVAANSGRSMNAEIVHALEKAFPVPVAPMDVNEALFDASFSILKDWGRTITAFGQNTADNPRFIALQTALRQAEDIRRSAGKPEKAGPILRIIREGK